MKRIGLMTGVLLALGLNVWTAAYGQAGQPVPPTTAYSRYWLGATNAVDGQARLGINAGALALSVTTNAIPYATVSSKGVANGLSSVTNNGKMFGPDTVVGGVPTVTSGLQEALNSFVPSTNQGPYVNGLHLLCESGYYFYTQALHFSYSNTYSVEIEGTGLLNTKLVYAGTTAGINTFWINGGGGGNTNALALNLPGHVIIHNIGFSALNSLTNVLLCVTNYSHANIYDCNFTSWTIMTNAAWGAAMSINGNTPRDDNVGLVIGNVAEHATWLQRLYFAGLADGVVAYCDHLYVDGLKSANVGFDQNLNHVTGWSTNHPYSMGALLIRRPGLTTFVRNMHPYTAHVGEFVMNTGNAEDQIIENIEFEGSDWDFVSQLPQQVHFVLDNPAWDGTTGRANPANGYAIALSNGIVQVHIVSTNAAFGVSQVLHQKNSGNYFGLVNLASEVTGLLPTAALNYNSEGFFPNGTSTFPVIDPVNGDIAPGNLQDDTHGNIKLVGPGSFLISSNVFPFGAWSVLAPCSACFWNSNGVVYLIGTNSISHTAFTNKLGP